MVTTSGMSSKKRNAQLAWDSSGLTAASMPACASVRRQSDPPRSGSMTHTGMPRSASIATFFSPSWNVQSR